MLAKATALICCSSDVNECDVGEMCKCAVSSSVNACGAKCQNTLGSFKCSCGSGYKLRSGTVCYGKKVFGTSGGHA